MYNRDVDLENSYRIWAYAGARPCIRSLTRTFFLIDFFIAISYINYIQKLPTTYNVKVTYNLTILTKLTILTLFTIC